MKKSLAMLCLLAPAAALLAQTYSLDWFTIAGGGGTSTGGQYSVTGGFWSLLSVVQTPGAPLLAIAHAGNAVIVSWDASVTGWTLQTNNNLTTGTWGNYTGAIVNNRVTNSPPTGRLFFRLKQP